MSTPKRYQFSNHEPISREPTPLPIHRQVGEFHPPAPQGVVGQVPQVVHIHEAPPDRTLQRVALGAGMGGGAVAAGVYFGPLLVAAMASMAMSLAVLALCVAVSAWAIVTVVRAVGGSDGQQAAKTLTKTRRGLRRRH